MVWVGLSIVLLCLISLHHGVGILYTRCHLLSDFFTPLKIPRFVVASDFFTPGDEPTGSTPHVGNRPRPKTWTRTGERSERF